MIVARWHIDAKFGHKQDVVDSLRQWHRDIGSQVGWGEDKVRLLTGSVGGHESTVIAEIAMDDLSALDDAWKRLATIEEHKTWSRDLEPHMVSGSTYWTVDKVL